MHLLSFVFSNETESPIIIINIGECVNFKNPEEIPRLKSGVIIRFLPEGTGFIITLRGF